MTSYRNSHNSSRSTRGTSNARTTRTSRLVRDDTRSRMTEEERRAKAREARRAERAARGNTRQRSRSIGADTLSMPATRAAGLPATRQRPFGRGETARRVEEERAASVSARPAVYTREATRRRSRLTLHGIPVAILIAILMAVAIASIVAVPARLFYLAWRQSGVLQVRYEVVERQNEELNDHVERLQSLEGIEDEARSHGYVYPGEEALVVDGVEEEVLADPTEADRAVQEYEESQPWYIHTLDSLFGYTPQ